MIRVLLPPFLARCLRIPRAEPDWVPVPYGDRHLYSEPPPRTFGSALTPDGKLAALEPRPTRRVLPPASRAPDRNRAAIRRMRREMEEGADLVPPDDWWPTD